jgi:hypothetical protein
VGRHLLHRDDADLLVCLDHGQQQKAHFCHEN